MQIEQIVCSTKQSRCQENRLLQLGTVAFFGKKVAVALGGTADTVVVELVVPSADSHIHSLHWLVPIGGLDGNSKGVFDAELA